MENKTVYLKREVKKEKVSESMVICCFSKVKNIVRPEDAESVKKDIRFCLGRHMSVPQILERVRKNLGMVNVYGSWRFKKSK